MNQLPSSFPLLLWTKTIGLQFSSLFITTIMEIKQLELIDHWIKVYVNQTNQCSHGIEIFDHSNSEKKHPLGFSNLGGVFILFLLGISVSTLMFLSEVCFPKN
ncbi:hypothetical protein OUZ56_028203 [Daphnia magna]|uniref:Uncharacterized protein n=1 Tax=Daphnia magna TaxID=35525 RepID=A0ABR0B355_9CRUS|nr:hypothetical protein OUZ56_028203 [Daphnia magna]